MRINTSTPTRTFAAAAATTIALLAGACGGNNNDQNADQDAQFDQRLAAENLDVEPGFARQQAHNACTDLNETTDDPANVDPFEVYGIAQRIAVRTGLSEDNAAKIAGLGIDIYCPEYKASWER
ncbi:uncharacterized protein DUF732 [Rhodococcus sp. SMB37]|uniref:DUF732 domain-containing protein n=1 Tax=Rhodococcus sp. SMB37 TaxID=2512213 RepID=UPI00105029F0|nr:DUF732 domain-containing protein [Rhodococcus sp. SMB37]TCN39918.1 uncharacterized protein DUF732 [Rhodococcus sp. SMB37]